MGKQGNITEHTSSNLTLIQQAPNAQWTKLRNLEGDNHFLNRNHNMVYF